MRACAHPGVVSVIELWQGDGLQALQALPAPYSRCEAALVMEAATQDLAAFLELHGSCLDAKLVREWSFNLASAVAHVHGNAFVHRGFQPANVLMLWPRHRSIHKEHSMEDGHVLATSAP